MRDLLYLEMGGISVLNHWLMWNILCIYINYEILS